MLQHRTPHALHQALALQRQACLAQPVPTLAERCADLRALQLFIRENKQALCKAISADQGHEARQEALLAEVFPAIDGLDHALRHLRHWMQPQHRWDSWCPGVFQSIWVWCP